MCVCVRARACVCVCVFVCVCTHTRVSKEGGGGFLSHTKIKEHLVQREYPRMEEEDFWQGQLWSSEKKKLSEVSTLADLLYKVTVY